MIVSVNSGRRILFDVFLVPIPDTVSHKDAKSTLFSSGKVSCLVFRPAPLYTRGGMSTGIRDWILILVMFRLSDYTLNEYNPRNEGDADI
jgi:hypothetical protein